MNSLAFTEFTLPNGSKLKNRIVKAAMEENMADVSSHNQPSQQLIKLYSAWGQGGAGLILSGHIMIDPLALACPGDVLLAEDSGNFNRDVWRQYISAAQNDGAQFWLQLNHPGRQVKKGSGLPTYAPSAIPLNLGRLGSGFSTPIAMTEGQIQAVIRRFAWAAWKGEELGASGVEIHAAHGYLISQFLSPLSNKRTDQWGGSVENRARLLFETIEAVRAAVSPEFGVGVKINTSDFQRGGFDADDLYWIVLRLNHMDLDFLELSGGSFESPAMSDGKGKAKSVNTAAREAYFIEAAKNISAVAKMPIMVTGGIITLDILTKVLKSSENFIAGIGTSLGLVPDLPRRWARGEDPQLRMSDHWILPTNLHGMAKTASVQWNLHLVGCGRRPIIGVWPTFALLMFLVNEYRQMREYKSWIYKYLENNQPGKL